MTEKRSIDLGAVAAALFGELDRLDACMTPEEIETEIARAKAVEGLAGKIIENSHTAVKVYELQVRAENGVIDKLAPLPPMLMAGGEER